MQHWIGFLGNKEVTANPQLNFKTGTEKKISRPLHKEVDGESTLLSNLPSNVWPGFNPNTICWKGFLSSNFKTAYL